MMDIDSGVGVGCWFDISVCGLEVIQTHPKPPETMGPE